MITLKEVNELIKYIQIYLKTHEVSDEEYKSIQDRLVFLLDMRALLKLQNCKGDSKKDDDILN